MHPALLFQPPYIYWLIGYSSAALTIVTAEHLLVTRLIPQETSPATTASNGDQPLRPAEFAYLLRHGDISHAVGVLAVDLTQRFLKNQKSPAAESNLNIVESAESSAESESADPHYSAPVYEADMWAVVKKHMFDWSAEQKESLMLENLRKNPVAYTRRITKIYNFFTHTLKSFVVQVTKDPRHLRRYFSMAGMLRLLSDFSIAGYQQIFEDQLKKDLLDRGLMVTARHKHSVARICFALSFILFLLVSALFFLIARVTSQTGILFVILLGATIGARLLYGLKEFLPYLDDVVQILRFLHRRSWRLALVRLLSRYIRLVLVVLCASVFVIPVAVAYMCFQLAGIPPTNPLIFLCLLTSLEFLVIVNLALRGIQILQEEYATTKGLVEITKLRRSAAGLSPLEVFVKMLQSKTYDQTFSDLVAIYGLETLLFLA